MKVAKRFRWEAAHRLPWHEGDCKNLHGHSYRMTVEFEGQPDERGMLVDFKVLKRLLSPLVDSWDHATLIAEKDEQLLELIRKTGWKFVVLPFDTTTENLCTCVIDFLNLQARKELHRFGVQSIRVRIAETETSYAEAERSVTLEGEESGGRFSETRPGTYIPKH